MRKGKHNVDGVTSSNLIAEAKLLLSKVSREEEEDEKPSRNL